MRARIVASFALACLVASCASGSSAPRATAPGGPAPQPAPTPQPRPAPLDQAPAFPAEPPPAMPMEPTAFPPFQERSLTNGARVIVVENHEQPYVSVNLRIRNGDASDPSTESGLAEMTADLLDKGTKTRDAKQIAESIDFVGGTLNAGSSQDWTSVTLGTLTEYLDTGLDLLADIVMNPTFPQDELEIDRKRTLSALQFQLSQPQTVAQRRFMREVYGSHPYGASETPESVNAITREDIVAFHQRYYHPSNVLFVVAGDVHADEVVTALNQKFGGWAKGSVPAISMPTPPTPTAKRLVFVDKPGSVQAVMRVGHLLPPASNRDWITIDVMNQILGGGVSGWLFQQLREKKGYTYGAYSNATENRGPGYFLATAEVRNEVADSALQGLMSLLEQMRSQPVPQKDLDAAKDYMTGSFPQHVETPTQVAGQVATTILLGRPADYLETYRQRVAATTVADIGRVAQQYLHPDRSVIVVVGDASKILDKVAPFADSVEIYDVSGNPVSRDQLSASAEPTPVDVDASAIQPRTTTYELDFQGKPVGEATTVVAREQQGGRAVVHVTTDLSIGAGQKQEVVFDGNTFEPIRSSASGGPATVELHLENGRITGSASMMGKTDSVDVAYEPGMLLPGMDQFVIGAADLASGKNIRMQIVSAQTGGAVVNSAHVAGDTTITVPAGTFEVYHLELTGATPLSLYVRKKAPHVVVRQEFAAQPVVMELKVLKEGAESRR